jgi:hypothetical protein
MEMCSVLSCNKTTLFYYSEMYTQNNLKENWNSNYTPRPPIALVLHAHIQSEFLNK